MLLSYRGVLQGDSAQGSVTPPARYWHRMCTTCVNGMPEECFITDVIAAFSRLTFISGMD